MIQHIDDVEIISIDDFKTTIQGFKMFYKQNPVMYLRETERSYKFIDVKTKKRFEFGYDAVKIEKVRNKFITVSYYCYDTSKRVMQTIGIVCREDCMNGIDNYLSEGFHITVRFFRES